MLSLALSSAPTALCQQCTKGVFCGRICEGQSPLVFRHSKALQFVGVIKCVTATNTFHHKYQCDCSLHGVCCHFKQLLSSCPKMSLFAVCVFYCVVECSVFAEQSSGTNKDSVTKKKKKEKKEN